MVLRKDKKTGIWKTCYYDPVIGYTRKKSHKTTDKQLGLIRHKIFLKDLEFGSDQTQGKYLLSELIDDFIDSKQNEGKFRNRTPEVYKSSINLFIKIVGDKITTLYSKQDWNIFLKKNRERQYSQNTIAIHSRQIHSYFNWLAELDYCKENIIKVIPPVKIKPIRIPKELLELIFEYKKKNNLKHYTYLKLAYFLALRPSEPMYIKKEWIDFENNIFGIYNSKKDRYIFKPMHKQLRDFLLDESGIDFTKPGELFNYKNYNSVKNIMRQAQKAMNREALRNNLPIPFEKLYTLKQLRKTASSIMANKGLNRFSHKTFMDHEKIETSYEYYTEEDLNLIRQEIDDKVVF